MSSEISRRGLFSAFRPGPGAGRDVVEPTIARIGAGCVEPKGVTCRRCGDECDARAIAFRPIGGGKAKAVLDADACTGCGACVTVCPAQAITMVAAERVRMMAALGEIAREQ